MTKRTQADDDKNTGFSFRENVVKHKPGFDLGSQEREPEDSGNHRFRRSEERDVPKESLAERIAKFTKGG